MRRLLPLLFLAATSTACGASAVPTSESPTASGGHEPGGHPRTEKVERTLITPTGGGTLSELFDAAQVEYEAERFTRSAKLFRQVYELEPKGRLAPHALMNWGASEDRLGNLERALPRYQEVSRRFPKHGEASEALVRSARILSYLERWAEAGRTADELLERRSQLTPFQQLVAHGAKALALVTRGEVEQASFHVERGRNIIDRLGLDRAGSVHRDLAQIYFALGEIRRLRGEAVTFNPRPAAFAVVLEQRCQLLLDAQSAYSDSMRAHDAHWSTMAGYRVGELYFRLHRDLMAVPPPETADTDARRELFEGAMRLRYSVLLKKGLGMMEHTLAMAKRAREQSEWVTRAEDAKRRLERAMKAEQQALDKLPFSRAQLQEVLDDIAAKAQAKSAAAP